MNIVNVYLPPSPSLVKRNIPEPEATEMIEAIMDQLQPQLPVIVCGDFNARISNRTPLLDDGHPSREAVDTYVCARAPWFI